MSVNSASPCSPSEITADTGGGEDAYRAGHTHPEAVDFIRRYGRRDAMERYLETVAASRAAGPGRALGW